MSIRRVSATEFARSLSSMLNEVRYQSASFEVWRGKECVARVEPPRSIDGFPVDRLDEFFAAIPRLVPGDARAFEQDLADIDRSLSLPENPWA